MVRFGIVRRGNRNTKLNGQFVASSNNKFAGAAEDAESGASDLANVNSF
jgi:hypothetical protein